MPVRPVPARRLTPVAVAIVGGDASPPHNRYEEALRKNNALDFDDLLGHTVALLRSAPAVQERYVRQFRCGGGCWVPVR